MKFSALSRSGQLFIVIWAGCAVGALAQPAATSNPDVGHPDVGHPAVAPGNGPHASAEAARVLLVNAAPMRVAPGPSPREPVPDASPQRAASQGRRTLAATRQSGGLERPGDSRPVSVSQPVQLPAEELSGFEADPRPNGAEGPATEPVAETARDGALAGTSGSESVAWIYDEPAEPEPLNLSGMAFRLFFGTAIVLCVCVGALFVGKWWFQAIGGSKGRRGSRIRCVESLAIAPRCCLQLLEVDDQKLVVALDSAGIKSVISLSGSFDDALEELHELAPQVTKGSGGVADERPSTHNRGRLPEEGAQRDTFPLLD